MIDDLTFTYSTMLDLGFTSGGPVAQDVFAAAQEEGSVVVGSFDAAVVGGGGEPNGLSYAITSLPAAGTVSNNEDGTFRFDPGSDFQGLAAGETRKVTFQYTATDPQDAVSNVATATITVTGVNDNATISGTVSGATDEDAAVNVTGALVAADLDDGEAHLSLNQQ